MVRDVYSRTLQVFVSEGKNMDFKIRVSFIFLPPVFFLFASSLSFAQVAGGDCERGFQFSRLHLENEVVAKDSPRSRPDHPTFIDPLLERKQVTEWGSAPNTRALLKFLLPDDVHFIKGQLDRADTATAVKMGEPGSALIARAYYNYEGKRLGTNVVFSVRALVDNMQNPGIKNWLVGENAQAAILFLHGGGTKSAGAHVGTKHVSHFRNYGVDVVALDLPWHSNGHREFMDFESEIKALGAFAQKYIPPHVPLFVMGHSWGSVFAEKLMMMTERPHAQFMFHKNLKGVIILSTAVVPASGKSMLEKYQEYHKRMDHVKRFEQGKAPDSERNLWLNIIADGKTSPLGNFYASSTIIQLDQILPEHKGTKWIPSLMVVGKHDPLVYLGFEDLYEYYKKLKNMKTYYLEELPLYTEPRGQPVPVGHLLGDFMGRDSKGEYRAIDVYLANQFMQAVLTGNFENWRRQATGDKEKKPQKAGGELLPENGDKKHALPAFIHLIQNFANDLAFRRFLKHFEYYADKRTKDYTRFRKKSVEARQQIVEHLRPYGNTQRRVYMFLNSIMTSNLRKDSFTSLSRELDFILSQVASPRTLAEVVHVSPRTLAEAVLELVPKNTLPYALAELYQHIKSGEEISKVQQVAQDIYNKHQGYWKGVVEQNAGGNRQSRLIRHISEAGTYQEMLQRVQEQRLPGYVEEKVTKLIKRAFDIESVLRGEYVPDIDAMIQAHEVYVARTEKSKPSEGRQATKKSIEKQIERVRSIVQVLSNTVQSQKQLAQERTKLIHQKRDLLEQYNKLLIQVKRSIKVIKEALEKVTAQPPTSLKTEEEKSHKEFEEVTKVHQKMEKVLDKLTAGIFETRKQETQTIVDSAEVLKVLLENKPLIEEFANKYSQYMQNRHYLRRRAIVAMENGEMGKEVQEAVLKVYGRGSGGGHPRLGSYSIYLDLEQAVRRLAEVESRLVEIRKIQMQIRQQYTAEINSLNNLVFISNEEDAELLVLAGNMSNVVGGIAITRVLDGDTVGVNLNAEQISVEDKIKVIEYIESNATMFDSISKEWNSLHSRMPPLLPTK